MAEKEQDLEKSRQFLASEYCQKVIEEMEKDPGDHDLWIGAVHAIDAPHVVFPGPTGGSTNLALKTLARLNAIHQPVCRLHRE